MAMSNNVFQEENNFYQFDFTSAVWATNELHDIFQNNKAYILSDVDFIAETENEIILLEYKNANIPSAAHPENFKPSDQKKLQKIAYKYYDSWIYLKVLSKNKHIHYVYILEYPNGDAISRKAIRNKIVNLLPFDLQKRLNIPHGMIYSFEVLSIEEWNAHSIYKIFPIKPVVGSK